MKKQQQSQNKMGRNKNAIIPKVQYHPTIQIHAAGDGPAVQASSSPTAKPSPQAGNRKVVQQNQVTDKIIPGPPGPRLAGGKKQKRADPKVAPRAVRAPDPSTPPGPDSGQKASGPGVVPADPEVQMDRVTIDKVEVLTRGQRTNPKWFTWRKNRITASVAHRIAHSRFANGKSETPPTSYLAAVTGESRRVQTRAMSWGIDNEERAVHRYQKWKSASLRRAVSVQECGLFIDTQRQWLAASPDGIVKDGQTGQWLLEVKCPHKHRDRRVEDACREDRNFCLEILDQDGEASQQAPTYRLKTSHSYYTQIQCQLAVTGLQRADLVVYTLKELAVVPVTFDPDMWEETVSKLEFFYTKAVLPHLGATAPRHGGAAWTPEL